MKEILFNCGMDIDRAFQALHEEAIKTGEVISGSFNGHTITSQMTLDKCYKVIVGKSKEEFMDEQRKRQERYEKEEREHQQHIPEKVEEYKEKAKGLIKEGEWDYFVKILPIRVGDLYHGMEIQSMLDIIRVLLDNKEDEAAALDEAVKVFEDQGHSGCSAGLVMGLVKRFSPVLGEEFVERVK